MMTHFLLTNAAPSDSQDHRPRLRLGLRQHDGALAAPSRLNRAFDSLDVQEKRSHASALHDASRPPCFVETHAMKTSSLRFVALAFGANVMARKLAHSLAVLFTSASSVGQGMQFAAGTVTAQPGKSV